MSDYCVDGFKFDGGTVSHYSTELINGPADAKFKAYERNIAWNDFGIRYKFHEYKDTFKGGGRRMIQRIRDRAHSWDNDGLSTLVPNAILQGILGHPYVCPDMIGGGEWTIKDLGLPVDEELFVRMAQCSAMFPMMQFSWAPWEALSEKYYECVKKAHDLHIEFSEIFAELADDAYKDGEPILRSLEYNYPGQGYAAVIDQFMMGEDLLVAPVLKKGASSRSIVLPPGRWLADDGKTYAGPTEITVKTPLSRLPHFTAVR
jgi:alpha-glucosidase (family GH31 glycosyl hydrolase)